MEFNFGNMKIELEKKIPRSKILDFDYDEKGTRYPSTDFNKLVIIDPITNIKYFETIFINEIIYDIMFMCNTFCSSAKISDIPVIYFPDVESETIQLSESMTHITDFCMFIDGIDEPYLKASFMVTDKRTGEITFEMELDISEDDIQTLFYALKDENLL